MDQWCKCCSSLSKSHLIDDTHLIDFGYSRIECNTCGTTYWSCSKCDKVYKACNFDYILTRQHMDQHNDVPELTARDNASNDDDSSDDEEEELEDDDDDDCQEQEDEHPNKIEQVFEVDSNIYQDQLEDSFDPIQLDLHGFDFQSFGNAISNTYFKQDYHMYHDHIELFGGIRGVYWRSRYRLYLHDLTHTVDMDDTVFMFNITNLLQSNTHSKNELLFEVLNDVLDRSNSDFNNDNPNVRIPLNETDASRICLEGKYGIFNNILVNEDKSLFQ